MRRILLPATAFIVLLAAASPLPAEEKPLLPQDVSTEIGSMMAEGSSETTEDIAEVLVRLVTVNPDDTPATLKIRNRPIVTLRARFATDDPQERVITAAQRFGKALSGREVPGATVKTFTGGKLIMVGDVVLIGLTSHDLDPLGGQTLEEATAEARASLELVLEEIREERSLKSILRALALSIVGSLALFLVLWAIAAINKLIVRRVAAGEKAVAKGVVGEIAPETRKVTAATRLIVSLLSWATAIFCFLIWLTFVLKRFPYTRPWGEEVYVFVYRTAKTILLGVAGALPNLVSVLLIFIIARILARLTRVFFDSVEQEKIRPPWVYPETAMPTRRLLVVIIWIFAFVAMYPYLPGSGSEAFKGLGVILGLMLSLGGSGVVSQAMSGLVLMYSRALRRGDYVRINETEGVVIALGMLATKIRTNKREEITIPNVVVLSTATKNYSRLAGKAGVILHTTITIGYTEPWRKVHEALIAAAGLTEGLKKEPKPFVNQTGLSDFYVEYQLNAHLESPHMRLPALARLHANIQDTFNKAGITIVSPHYVADPEQELPAGENSGR